MRYKEYNTNRVLEKCIALFWQRGFNGCSVNDIVEETGVNRFSLYHEFGNKEGILYHSLKRYRERYCDDKLSLLDSKDELNQVLKGFYLAFLQDSTPVPGCYFIHIGTELADEDPEVKAALDNYLHEVQELLFRLLMRHGYQQDEAAFQARHLLGLYCTVMSFCLIHTEQERAQYITNGIQLILSTAYAESTS